MTSASERRTHGMVQGLACQVPQEGELMAWYRDLLDNCTTKENSRHEILSTQYILGFRKVTGEVILTYML